MNNLLFDFTVDKEKKTVTVTREFDAELSLVWDAFTKAEILDQWWAPKPFMSKTKILNFEVGGRRFYAMVSPDGWEKWVVQKYTSITPKTNFKFFNAFADENENLELPGSDWDHTFTEKDGKTTVSVSIYNESLERMEKQLAMGFTEGFKMTMGQLDELLTAEAQRRRDAK
jgi:uncharacterized protein YndB with AHSA1/START domain